MNNYEEFVHKENVDLLWDVLLDTLKVNINNNQLINNIQLIFNSNLNMFLNPNSNIFKTELININKYFLSQLINAINILIPNLDEINNIETKKNIKKINISDEVINEPYKVEDIHSLRLNNFEKELEIKKNDFDNLINTKKPNNIDFKIEINENKITEMENLISETIKQRNYDIENIQKEYEYNNKNVKEWLNTTNNSSNSYDINDFNNSDNINNTNNTNDTNDTNDKQKKVTFNIIDNLNKWNKVHDSNVSNELNILNKLKKNNEYLKNLEKDNKNENNYLNLINEKLENLNNKIEKLIDIITILHKKDKEN